MKLASFTQAGRKSFGAVLDNGVIDIGRRLGQPSLREILAAGRLDEAMAVAKSASADMALADIVLLPPIPDPEKIVCLGLNYRAHAQEAKLTVQNPRVFIRLTNSIVPSEGALVRPKLSDRFDYEGELAVIIGKPGRHIARADAMAYIAGYSCFNDGSVRDYQFDHSVTVGKNFFASGSFGPWMVTADSIPDPSQLTLSTRLNGVELQHTSVGDLILDIPDLLVYISAFTPLAAGDVIVTGTPEGVGNFHVPPLWMKPGDVVEVEISDIGVLRNDVVAEA